MEVCVCGGVDRKCRAPSWCCDARTQARPRDHSALRGAVASGRHNSETTTKGRGDLRMCDGGRSRRHRVDAAADRVSQSGVRRRARCIIMMGWNGIGGDTMRVHQRAGGVRSVSESSGRAAPHVGCGGLGRAPSHKLMLSLARRRDSSHACPVSRRGGPSHHASVEPPSAEASPGTAAVRA